MRKRIVLLLIFILPVVIGAIGAPAFALGPPSSGTPTGLSTYGSIVIGTSFVTGSDGYHVYLAIFSTSGPFYVEKVNAAGSVPTGSMAPLLLGGVVYDGLVYAFSQPNATTQCPTIIPSSSLPMLSAIYGSGEIISVTPSTMKDPSGATAISAAEGVIFDLRYSSCVQGHLVQFPSTLMLSFEATVLAPTTTAIISICEVEGMVGATACPS